MSIDFSNLTDLNELILKWGKEKGILPNPEPMCQLEKTEEEVAELRKAIEEHDIDEVKDALGDIYVTLTMQAEAWGFTMEECVQAAYDVIKNRTGKMVNGKFIKDE
jgi:NTP pyrophosphatase (non-canonical NTP hydrolase)